MTSHESAADRQSQADLLATQARRRPLTDVEHAFATALEAIYATGVHDCGKVADELNARKAARPSGSREAWNSEAVLNELATINASLDEAYAQAPAIPVYGTTRSFLGGR